MCSFIRQNNHLELLLFLVNTRIYCVLRGHVVHLGQVVGYLRKTLRMGQKLQLINELFSFLLMKIVDLFRTLVEDSTNAMIMSRLGRLRWSIKVQNFSLEFDIYLQGIFQSRRELLQES